MGTVQELFSLTDTEAGLVEIAVDLMRDYRARLTEAKTTTAALAAQELLGKNAAHVLEEEVATIDALIEGLLAVGATFEEIGKTIAAVTLPTG